MSKLLKNDRIFKRPLVWLFLLGLLGMLTYIFLPLREFGHQIATPSSEQIDHSAPATSSQIKDAPKSGQREEGADVQPAPIHPIVPNQSSAAIASFVKKYQTFIPKEGQSNLEAMRAAHFNPTLIAQLLPLKKRLQDPSISAIDVLYADYQKNGKIEPHNSKVIAIRFHKNEESTIFFSRREKNGLFFYDENGNAPELAMDRIPLSHYERISSPFNPRRLHPITHRIRPHNGTDFKAPYGTPVHSTGNGIVSFAGWQRGYGKIVIIEHPNGYQTRYAHLSAIKAKKGDAIIRGEVIGKLGNTGASTGAHLHYEVRVNDTPFDPMKIELPSVEPVASSDMKAWKYRCAQQGKVMADLASEQKK